MKPDDPHLDLELCLERRGQLLSDEIQLLTGSRLRFEVGEWIERECSQRRQLPQALVIVLPPSETLTARECQAELLKHFIARRRQHEMARAETVRKGIGSAKIGFLLWVLLLSFPGIAQHFGKSLPEFLSEGFTVLVWVALWRPAEELIYDWYPHVREIRRYSRLEKLPVRIRFGPDPERAV